MALYLSIVLLTFKKVVIRFYEKNIVWNDIRFIKSEFVADLSTRWPLTSWVVKCISLNNKSQLTAPTLISSNPDECVTFDLWLILIDMMKQIL